MGQFAVVENGVVVNMAVAEQEFADLQGWLPGEGAQIGWLWDGKAFKQPPPLEKSREQLKEERDAVVAAIKVTTSKGMVFDGDEDSQGRMARAILALRAAGRESTVWILANNDVVDVTAADLEEALVLAGEAQTAVWPI